MTTSYTYSLSVDFHGAINSYTFGLEVMADTAITEVYNGVVQDGDVVTVYFDSALTTDEKTSLDAVVAAHDGTVVTVMSTYHTSLPINSVSTSELVYKVIATYLYDTSYYVSLDKILLTSYIDPGDTSYDIRIYDSTNNNTLATTNFTNSTKGIVTVSPLTNVPTIGISMIEIQGKVNTGASSNNNLYVSTVDVYLS